MGLLPRRAPAFGRGPWPVGARVGRPPSTRCRDRLSAWGPWINGGAWLQIEGRRVDWLYRDLGLVAETVAECRAGRPACYYQPGHPHGLHSHIYTGEVHYCRPLVDSSGDLAALKAITAQYPPGLKVLPDRQVPPGSELRARDLPKVRGARRDVLRGRLPVPLRGVPGAGAVCAQRTLLRKRERLCKGGGLIPISSGRLRGDSRPSWPGPRPARRSSTRASGALTSSCELPKICSERSRSID